MSTSRPTAFVVLSTNHGPLLVNRHDYVLTPTGDGGGVGYELFKNSEFESSEIRIMKNLLDSRRKTRGDGLLCLDVGANIGVHTVELARHLHGWGSVVAFEAQERVFYALAGNIAMNNLFNARAVWSAVDEKPGFIDIPALNYLTPSSFGSFELRPSQIKHQNIGQAVNYVNGKTSRVTSISIDSLDLPRVDFIKMDIEGMEISALNGARATIEKYRPTIFVEYTKSDPNKLSELLFSAGYLIGSVAGNFIAIHANEPESVLLRAAASAPSAL